MQLLELYRVKRQSSQIMKKSQDCVDQGKYFIRIFWLTTPVFTWLFIEDMDKNILNITHIILLLRQCGYTDGRLGINGLVSLIHLHYKQDPYEKGTLFLFCGRRKDRCKAILWEGDGFLLLTKRLSNGRFCWPGNEEELRQLDSKQYQNLMEGFEIEGRIKKRKPKYLG